MSEHNGIYADISTKSLLFIMQLKYNYKIDTKCTVAIVFDR